MANPNMVKGMASVNPLGRARWKPLTDAIRVELTANPKAARRIARRLIQESVDGNLEAMKILFDRMEGKALQLLEVGEPGAFMDVSERQQRILELHSKMVEDAVTIPMLPNGVKE